MVDDEASQAYFETADAVATGMKGLLVTVFALSAFMTGAVSGFMWYLRSL